MLIFPQHIFLKRCFRQEESPLRQRKAHHARQLADLPALLEQLRELGVNVHGPLGGGRLLGLGLGAFRRANPPDQVRLLPLELPPLESAHSTVPVLLSTHSATLANTKLG